MTESLCDLLQQLVTGSVPQRVVHDLEAIEIEEDKRALTLVSSSLLDRVTKQLAEQRSIGQTGQLVVSRKIPDTLLGIPARGDVFDDGDVVQQRAVCAAPHRTRDANPECGAVLAQIALFRRQRIDLARVESFAVAVRDARVVRVRDLPHRELRELLARVPQHVPKPLVRPSEPASIVDMRYTHGGELHGARVASLAFPQPILERAPLRDVLQRALHPDDLPPLVDRRFTFDVNDALASVGQQHSDVDRLRRAAAFCARATANHDFAVVGVQEREETIVRAPWGARIDLQHAVQLVGPPLPIVHDVPHPAADFRDPLRRVEQSLATSELLARRTCSHAFEPAQQEAAAVELEGAQVDLQHRTGAVSVRHGQPGKGLRERVARSS